MALTRRQLLKFTGTAGIAGCLMGCHSAPLTDRRQLILLPESREIALGLEAFDEVVMTEPVSQNLPLTQLVHRVGNRIADASGRLDYDWDFRLIADPTQNAFALPGGKVAIYEGILPVLSLIHI